MVFDGSMKTSTGVSLNDVMLKGPKVQEDIFDIICRFRKYKFVFTSDIEKMYRQIMINQKQTNCQSILWRENQNMEIKCIELLTVTYGTKAAPYLATRALKKVAEENKNKFPLAAESILKQCYVDGGKFRNQVTRN